MLTERKKNYSENSETILCLSFKMRWLIFIGSNVCRWRFIGQVSIRTVCACAHDAAGINAVYVSTHLYTFALIMFVLIEFQSKHWNLCELESAFPTVFDRANGVIERSSRHLLVVSELFCTRPNAPKEQAASTFLSTNLCVLFQYFFENVINLWHKKGKHNLYIDMFEMVKVAKWIRINWKTVWNGKAKETENKERERKKRE